MSLPVDLNTLTQMEDYLEVWILAFLKSKQSENLSKKSILFYKQTLDIFIEYCQIQSLTKIGQITPSYIREFLLWLENKGHNSGGIHAEFRSLRAFLFWYWEETEPNSPNPIKKVKPPRVIQEPIEGITPEQFRILLEACPLDTFTGLRDAAIISVLMDTGIRANELCSIRLQDIEIEASSILIRHTKNNQIRMAFFGNKTRRLIRKYAKERGNDSPYLFINRDGEKLVFNALKEILRRLGRVTGIAGITAHDFRRGFCLAMLNKGMDLLTLSRLMGHTGLSLLGRYARQTTVDLQRKYQSIVDD